MIPTFDRIELQFQEGIATIWLNQPEIRNAMNPDLLQDLTAAVNWLNGNKQMKAIIIRGRGRSFCAGADIKWLESSGKQSYEKNYAESEMLADCFKAVYNSNKVVINLVHGHAFGGALGLLGAGDFSFSMEDTLLGLPELKLGVFSAVITPYLLLKISLSDLKYKIFTGRSFSANEAMRIGIVDKTFQSTEEMEVYTNELLVEILDNSQEALAEGKKLFREFNQHLMKPEHISNSIKTLTDLKISADAKERMQKFINKN